MNTYSVKTRNWNCNRFVLRLLCLSRYFGANGWPEQDGDGKFYLSTQSAFRAWACWAWFMVLKPFTGGWTYIVRPGHALGEGYKAIY